MVLKGRDVKDKMEEGRGRGGSLLKAFIGIELYNRAASDKSSVGKLPLWTWCKTSVLQKPGVVVLYWLFFNE